MTVRFRVHTDGGFLRIRFGTLALALIALPAFFTVGCVESRARHTPVPPTSTATVVPVVQVATLTPTATPTPTTPVQTATATPVLTATPMTVGSWMAQPVEALSATL